MTELTFNKKDLRKGKAIGLPYMGSKKKIAKQIVQIIKDNFGKSMDVYDLFGGGGAITAELALQGFSVHYNELNPDVKDMFLRAIQLAPENVPNYIVTRDEFFEIKSKPIKDTDDNLKLLINSFGDNMQSYIYSKNICQQKYTLAKSILKTEGVSANYKRTPTYAQWIEHRGTIGQLNQLNKLNNLQQLQQLQPKHFDSTSYSYEDFSDLKNTIIYLDPPYENAVGYVKVVARKTPKDEYQKIRKELLAMPEGSVIVRNKIQYKLGTSSNNRGRMYEKDLYNGFDSEKLYDWAVKMADNNIVIISSYEISDPRFEVVHEFATARSTMAGGHRGIQRTEKLFMVKKEKTK